MMVLEALFHGGIYPQEQICPKTQTYRDSTARSEELTDQLKSKLTPEGMELLKELKQSISVSDCEEAEEYFHYGLALGILLMCEALDVAERHLAR